MKSKYPEKVIYEIPYYSQWESRELANGYIKNPESVINDPLWANSGALSKEEYALWSNNVCGMACVKMILGYFTKNEYQTIKMAKDSLAYGAYTISGNNIEGLFYKGCVAFLKGEFDIEASWLTNMSVDNIVDNLSKNNLVIASVSKYIRDTKPNVINKGGHLVVVVGFDTEKGLLYIHNPSGYYPDAQSFFPVTYDIFNECFANRGIIIYEKSK